MYVASHRLIWLNFQSYCCINILIIWSWFRFFRYCLFCFSQVCFFWMETTSPYVSTPSTYRKARTPILYGKLNWINWSWIKLYNSVLDACRRRTFHYLSRVFLHEKKKRATRLHHFGILTKIENYTQHTIHFYFIVSFSISNTLALFLLNARFVGSLSLSIFSSLRTIIFHT